MSGASRKKPRLGRLLGALLAVAYAVALPACPPEEVRIEITELGGCSLFGSCLNPDCDASNRCCLPGHPTARLGASTIQLRLFVADPVNAGESLAVRASSRCSAILPCPLAGICATRPEKHQTPCYVDAMNRAVDDALVDGFDVTPGSAGAPVVFAAIYEPTDSSQCDPSALVACMGLTPITGGDGTYDVTCSSCQGGSDKPTGLDTGPCVRRNQTRCFLNTCMAAITGQAAPPAGR